MYLRFLNDMHNECGECTVHHLDTDKDTILLLAGDIYDRKRLMPWLHKLAPRFKHIVMVRGNHDYWNGSMEQVEASQQDYKKQHKLDNVHLLNCDHVMIDGLIFYGGTMWTDYNKQDPITRMSFKVMKDYDKIRVANYGKRFTPDHGYHLHLKFKSGLKALLEDESLSTRPVFVISHHAPCHLSIADKYLHETVTNGFYVSDLSSMMLDDPRIVLWHHGHLHNVSDYMLGATRIICNPIGYPGEIVPGSNPTWRETISDLLRVHYTEVSELITYYRD